MSPTLSYQTITHLPSASYGTKTLANLFIMTCTHRILPCREKYVPVATPPMMHISVHTPPKNCKFSIEDVTFLREQNKFPTLVYLCRRLPACCAAIVSITEKARLFLHILSLTNIFCCFIPHTTQIITNFLCTKRSLHVHDTANYSRCLHLTLHSPFLLGCNTKDCLSPPALPVSIG